MHRKVLLLSLALLTVALAGCSDDGDSGGDETGTGTSTGTGTGTETGTGTGGGVSYTWSNESVSGSFTSIHDQATGSSLSAEGDFTFDFEVTSDAARLEVLMTATGNNAQMLIADPNCEVSATSTCEERVQLPAGEEVLWGKNTPKAGTWNVRFFGADEGPNQVEWAGTVGLLIPA